MNRREFTKSCVVTASAMALHQAMGQRHEPTDDIELDARQLEIDTITPKDFKAYYMPGSQMEPECLTKHLAQFPVLERLEAAFDKIFREAQDTVVTDINRPTIWYVYNMGLVIKTPKTLFSIDLHHRRAEEFAPFLNFALITHNHNDHYTERFKVAMDRGQHKPVVNNFFDNYGVKNRKLGGYTRARSKTFQYEDIKISGRAKRKSQNRVRWIYRQDATLGRQPCIICIFLKMTY